eukprot:TRINITY_DN791_c1_g1_i1.p1 TRINITY_DN791_c1_g1~~TRINITY_DN791_c1_g1_i1.p1  ORF type:complete len:607 (+),score=84.63 TRINITY_DN791_c1_g1_i1:344-2164(+)
MWCPDSQRTVRCPQPLKATRQGTAKNKYGRTGIMNLGNTCYMNSALQCLSHTKLLREYFTRDHYVHHLNSNNPIAFGGEIASVFAQLMKNLWAGNSYVIPTVFRRTLAPHMEAFASVQQQDAQEFLVYLLDALHEEVNRVIDKPYINKPEIQEAASSWDHHLIRNQSAIVDLFQGMLKSILECDTCHKVSVAFDPMMYFSIPVQCEAALYQYITVAYRPLDLSLPTTWFRFKVLRGGSVTQATRELYSILGTSSSEQTIQLYLHHFRHMPLTEDNTMDQVSIFAANHSIDPVLEAYEHLPVKKNPTPKGKEKPVENMTILAQVIHRRAEESDGDDDDDDEDVVTIIRVDANATNAELYDLVRDEFEDSTLHSLEFEREACYDCPRSHSLMFAFEDCCSRQQDPQYRKRKERSILSHKHIRLYAYWSSSFAPTQSPDVNHSSVTLASRPLSSSTTLTLDYCLRQHNTTEQLDWHNPWYCPDCKTERCAFKTLSLWKLPKYLVIQLKKFSFNSHGIRRKIDAQIIYPTKGLDMRPYLDSAVRDSVDNTIYDLYATVLHHGSVNMGHFTSTAKSNGRWYYFDDDVVEEIREEDAVDHSAYLLFYEKRET